MNDHRDHGKNHEQSPSPIKPRATEPSQTTPDEMSDDELEEIVGGLTTVLVPLCKHCHERVAVHEMTLCAVCFRKLKQP